MQNIQKEKHCDVTPDISIMKKMASVNGTIPSRIMELVDNSIDARIPGLPLVIDVNIVKKGKKQYIEVLDNGCGMSEIVAKTFFRLADSQKQGKKKIGKFGMGSKVAIMGMGDTCIVETVPYGEDYCIKFLFDIRRFKKWDIPYTVGESDGKTHGTKIRIENLTVNIHSVNRICERLYEQFSKTYKHFLSKENVTIRINGQNVLPQEVELLPGFYQEFDFEVKGKRVYGWCGAKKTTGANWKFGFDLISNGRIIKQNDFLTRVPHQSLSRLTGEIHLDEFATDVHKTDFIRHDPLFESMQERLLAEIEGMITKISKMTNKEVFEKFHPDMQQVSKSLNKVLNSYVFLNQIHIEEGIFKKMKQKAKNPEDKQKVKQKQEEEPLDVLTPEEEVFEPPQEMVSLQEEVEERNEKPKRKKDSGLVIEEPVGVTAGYEQPPRRWAAIEREDVLYLNVEVNLDHPTYSQLEDEKVSVQMQNAVLDSVAEFILEEEKKQQSGMIDSEIERLNQIKDMLIRCSLVI